MGNAKGGLAPRCFNIIDSVKGGSGKTSLSLMLTLTSQYYGQAEETREAGQSPKNYSLLIDMDMQGSTLEHLLFGDMNTSDKAPNTLNDAILKYYTKATPNFISRPELLVSDSLADTVGGTGNGPLTELDRAEPERIRIAAALASPKMEDRERFRAVSRMNYSSQITYAAFRSGLKTVLKAKNLNSYLADELQYVFFDMPPNSNGYSDCVLELLLEQDGLKTSLSHINHSYPRNYFELMTFDLGHIEATLDWFRQFVKGEAYSFPDHFFFVFCNVPQYILDKIGWDSHIGILQDKLKQMGLERRLLNRIYFVGVNYQEAYLKRCCESGTLASAQEGLDREILAPIAFVKDFCGKDLTRVTATKELLSLMRTRA